MAAALSSAFTLRIVPSAVEAERCDDGHAARVQAPSRIGAVRRRDGLADEAELGHAVNVDGAVGGRRPCDPRRLECRAELVRDRREAGAHARQHGRVGHAAAAHEARLDAALARQRADLRAAAVHDADARLARRLRHGRHAVERRVAAQLDDRRCASRRVLRVERHVLGRERRRVQLGAAVARRQVDADLDLALARARHAPARARPRPRCRPRRAASPPTHTATRSGSSPTPHVPARASMRPQLGSAPCSAQRTRMSSPIARTAVRASSSSAAPVTV